MSSSSVTIAIDAMSGDRGQAVIVPAACRFAIRKGESVNILLVGQSDPLTSLCTEHSAPRNVSVIHADSVVDMSDRPAVALRSKQDSSMSVSIGLVQSGQAEACVSSGNTGALMALSKHLLGTFPGIDRPAITKFFSSGEGGSYLLDLGANVDCSAEHLLQFALMGSTLSCAARGIDSPSVALLNVGGESIKGNAQIRLADALLKQNDHVINYIGFVEGGDIFRNKADVIVCDGFVGNVALKAIEGTAKTLNKAITEHFRRSIVSKLIGRMVIPVLFPRLSRFNPSSHNGAMFLGLDGVVVKSHGNAGEAAFENAIEIAYNEASRKVPSLINEHLASLQF